MSFRRVRCRAYDTVLPQGCHWQGSTMIVNLAAYRFVALDGLASLRARLLDCCVGTGIRGTVLLAGEGINLSIAGTAADVARLRRCLDHDVRLANLEYRETRSDHLPFQRF